MKKTYEYMVSVLHPRQFFCFSAIVNFQYFLQFILVSLNIVFIFYETPISVLEFELRKAQETIKSLRQSLTRSAGILSYLFMFSLSRFTNIVLSTVS